MAALTSPFWFRQLARTDSDSAAMEKQAAFNQKVRENQPREGCDLSIVAIEQIISASKSIGDIDKPLPVDVRATLFDLRERYDSFASDHLIVDPRTYRQARSMLVDLFF